MKTNNKLNQYEQEAEEVFNNFDGDYDEDFDDYEEDFDDDYDEDYDDEEDFDEDYDDEEEEDFDEYFDGDDYEEDFMGAQPCSTSQKSISQKRYLTFRLKNNAVDGSGNPIKSTATLFGSYGSSVGKNTGIAVSLDENDYEAFLSETAANPYTLANPRYRVLNATQYANSFKLEETQSTGDVKSRRVQPQNFENPANNNDKLILMKGFGMIADGKNKLIVDLEAGEDVSIAFEVVSRVNNSNLLKGKKASQGGNCDCGSRRGGRNRRGGGRGGNRGMRRGGRNRRGGANRRSRNRY